jgi:hypothetical protein
MISAIHDFSEKLSILEKLFEFFQDNCAALQDAEK